MDTNKGDYLYKIFSNCNACENDIKRAISELSYVDEEIEYHLWNDSKWTYKNTPLYIAADSNNICAVELLLKAGADPDFIPKDESPVLWEMQYNDENSDNDNVRLDITKLLLDYGADPYIKVDGEKLIQYVDYKVFVEMGSPGWEYICRFFMYLLAYDSDPIPMTKPIDRSKLKDYKIVINVENQKTYMHIYNENGEDIIDNAGRR